MTYQCPSTYSLLTAWSGIVSILPPQNTHNTMLHFLGFVGHLEPFLGPLVQNL